MTKLDSFLNCILYNYSQQIIQILLATRIDFPFSLSKIQKKFQKIIESIQCISVFE